MPTSQKVFTGCFFVRFHVCGYTVHAVQAFINPWNFSPCLYLPSQLFTNLIFSSTAKTYIHMALMITYSGHRNTLIFSKPQVIHKLVHLFPTMLPLWVNPFELRVYQSRLHMSSCELENNLALHHRLQWRVPSLRSKISSSLACSGSCMISPKYTPCARYNNTVSFLNNILWLAVKNVIGLAKSYDSNTCEHNAKAKGINGMTSEASKNKCLHLNET